MDLSELKKLPNIIIDLGANSIKFGFSCDLYPKYVIPNILGRVKPNLFSPIKNYDNFYCGYDALYNSCSLDLSYPLLDNEGKFSFKEEYKKDYEKLFHYIFKEKLQIDEVNYNILLIDSIFTSSKEHEIIAQILFEKFKIFNLHFEPQCIMSLYSTSKSSGLIINSGEISTEIVPIYEGYIISNCINKFPIGGYHLTQRFMEKYKNDFEMFNVSNKYYMAQKIKEKYSQIFPTRKDYEDIMNKNDNDTNKLEYNLPDGNIIELNKEIYQIPELIFNPNDSFNIQSQTLPEIIVDTINKCEISTRKELFNNIILGGGNTCIKGFEQRLKTEINNIRKKNCGIISLEERGYSAWIGASRISTWGSFDTQWITRTEFFNRGLIENDYSFNFSGLNDKQRNLMMYNNNIINPDEIYKKYIMREQI